MFCLGGRRAGVPEGLARGLRERQRVQARQSEALTVDERREHSERSESVGEVRGAVRWRSLICAVICGG